MRLRAEAELANPANTKPASEQNPVESETATLQPLWNIWSDVRQVVEIFYYKQLYRTAPITVYAIVEPNAATPIPIPDPTQNPATSSASAYDDMDSIEKINAELARMERDWAETRARPFPEGIRNAFEELRVEQVKQDTEAAQSIKPISAQVQTEVKLTHTTMPTPATVQLETNSIESNVPIQTQSRVQPITTTTTTPAAFD